MDPLNSTARHEEFVRRLMERRPQDQPKYEAMLEPVRAPLVEGNVPDDRRRAIELETIVNAERPVLFVRDGRFDPGTAEIGPEAAELIAGLNAAGDTVRQLLPLVGRIDVLNFPGTEFVGSGWFVADDVVVTNRHVASLVARWDGRQFAFTRGVAGRVVEPSVCTAHEFEDVPPAAPESVFRITRVLYIEPDSGPNDIAFVKVARPVGGGGPRFIPVAPTDAAVNDRVCVVGYPARAPRRVIPDQALMERLYQGKYDVKRVAPGLGMGTRRQQTEHDCTTLGGNSGSVVLDFAGRAVGLHFAGLYRQANYAMRASVLNEYVRQQRWNRPYVVREVSPPPASPPPPPGVTLSVPGGGGGVSVTVPLTITLTLGTPVVGGGGTAAPDEPKPPTVADAEAAVIAFWPERPLGVVAARVGFDADDRPFVAASVPVDQLAEVRRAGPAEVRGVPVRYFAADADEQVQALPAAEAADEIAYDDDARTGDGFSFAAVDEEMEVTLHVGPEYSWEVLERFLDGTPNKLVASMYEFHARHIRDALHAKQEAGVRVKMVLDAKTFHESGDADEFDAQQTFADWAERFRFQRVVAPAGRSGLMSSSYHTKVAVRDDGAFWLSSGNWKPGSSQPVVSQAQRDAAADEDLPGNREWHVVVKNPTLADRFRNHILQDFTRATDLGGREVPRRLLDESVILVPEAEGVVEERRPPGRVKKPLTVSRRVKVKPIMTPDREGEVYADAVLALIESATDSLLFQIPYISMPADPTADRGFIDTLLAALVRKLRTLPDARVLLRSGSRDFSSPRHAAWYFRSKGVDIDTRLRVIDDHHTKGMVADGKRVLVGSHNWSKPGVSLNRDASLVFDDEEVAMYFADAFEIDWQRANRITPRQFVPEGVLTESVGGGGVPFRRVTLSDLDTD